MLSSERIFLRPLEAEDLDFLYALENDPSIWGVSDTLAPVSRHLLRQYLDNASADVYAVRQLRLVICESATRTPVGTLDIFEVDPMHQRAGVGITILQAFRQQGFAKTALELLVPYAREVLRLHQIYCTIGISNRPSQHLFTSVGFQLVGTRKEWLRTESGWEDVVEMQLML